MKESVLMHLAEGTGVIYIIMMIRGALRFTCSRHKGVSLSEPEYQLRGS